MKRNDLNTNGNNEQNALPENWVYLRWQGSFITRKFFSYNMKFYKFGY